MGPLPRIGKPSRYPSAAWVKHCERLVELDQKLPSVLLKLDKFKDTSELTELGDLCLIYKKHFVAAARLYEAALQMQPALASQRGYKDALAAVLAAAGKGKDADQLKEEESAKLRQQALVRLKQKLTILKKQMVTGPNAVVTVHKMLKSWQADPDMESVRKENELAKLPEAEREQWQAFWSEVKETLKLPEGNNGKPIRPGQFKPVIICQPL